MSYKNQFSNNQERSVKREASREKHQERRVKRIKMASSLKKIIYLHQVDFVQLELDFNKSIYGGYDK